MTHRYLSCVLLLFVLALQCCYSRLLLRLHQTSKCLPGFFYSESQHSCLQNSKAHNIVANPNCVTIPIGNINYDVQGYDLTNLTQQERKKCQSNYIYNRYLRKCVCQQSDMFDNGTQCVECVWPNYWNRDSLICLSCPQFKIYNSLSGNCQDCPHCTPFFDNYSCIACQNNTIFSQDRHLCLSYSQYCSQGYNYNHYTRKCQCPADKPYDNGNTCIQCSSAQYWDAQNLQCQDCPAFQYYDKIQLRCKFCSDSKPLLNGTQCIPCPERTIFVKESQKCIRYEDYCPPTLIFDQVKMQCSCPNSAPFYDGQKCYTCYLPKFWNFSTRHCESCPEQQYYNTTHKLCQYCPIDNPYLNNDSKCTQCPKETLFNANSHICVQYYLLCSETYYFNEKSLKCQCPQNQHDNGTECVTCSQLQYWNYYDRKCEYCSEYQQYNKQTQACQPCPIQRPFYQQHKCISCPQGTLFINSTKVCITYAQYCGNYVYNYETKKCICPTQKPYDTGSQCIDCKKPNFWNSSTKLCQSCQQFKYYNNKTQACEYCPSSTPFLNGSTCVQCPQRYLFVLSKRVCISYQDYCNQTYIYNEVNRRCQCPSSAPYDNKNKCLSCDFPYYWNISSLACQICPKYQYYDTLYLECKYCPQSKPFFDNYMCATCPIRTIYVDKVKRCVTYEQYCPNTYIYNQILSRCECPTNLFDNGSACVQCFLPNFWNCKTMMCESCPQFQIYNQNTKICQYCPQETPFLDQNNKCISCPNSTFFQQANRTCVSFASLCLPSYVYDVNTSRCQCPMDKPYDTTNQCISCQKPRYWNQTSLTCDCCSQEQYYDTSQKKCKYCPSDKPIIVNFECQACPSNTIFIKQKNICQSYEDLCENNYVYNTSAKKCICPQNAPFDDGQRCVTCYLPKYWNYTSTACQNCPAYKYYDTVIRNCVFCPSDKPVLINNVCTSCSSEYFYDETYHSCLKKKSDQCPDTFYLDQQTGLCVCPYNQLFNGGKYCVPCIQPKVWNKNNFECENPQHLTFVDEA